MAEFLEERLPVDVRMGATYADEYAVEITETANGNEHLRLVHPYPRRVFNVSYMKLTADLWGGLLALYHRAYGMYAGFRVKCLDDYTTNARILAPTATDQTLAVVTGNTVYQLQVAYGSGGTPLGIGEPVRTIFKPVTGTIKIAVSGVVQPETVMYSASTTTGRITFNADKTNSISGITQGALAEITLGSHSFYINETVHISGVSGMVGLNGMRVTIVTTSATTIVVNVNTTAFPAWTSGGVVHSAPQPGEPVTGGCEFDIPCRFNSRIDQIARTHELFETGEIEIIEKLNP